MPRDCGQVSIHLLQGCDLGFEYLQFHMINTPIRKPETVAINQSSDGSFGMISPSVTTYTPPKYPVTRETITTTKEYDQEGRVVKEITVKETVTENVQQWTNQQPPQYIYTNYDNDVKYGSGPQTPTVL